MDRNGKINSSSRENMTCHMCGSSDMHVRKEEDRFKHRNAGKTVFLTAIVNVYKCNECSMEYTDSEADDLRHEAVCNHLGRLTPKDILRIRESMNMSQKEFADETKIGEASLSRWERGYLIQNDAMDNFLYLLSQPGILEILRKRRSDSPEYEEPRFRNILNMEEARNRKNTFSLLALRPAI